MFIFVCYKSKQRLEKNKTVKKILDLRLSLDPLLTPEPASERSGAINSCSLSIRSNFYYN